MCFRIFPRFDPPHFITVFKSVVPSTRLFKSELSHTCTLVVDFGDLITKIYQSRHKCRACLSKSPKKHTGANHKRMAKKSALMGTVPKEWTEITKIYHQGASMTQLTFEQLVEGTTLLNTVTKCGGIESGGDPKTHF